MRWFKRVDFSYKEKEKYPDTQWDNDPLENYITEKINKEHNKDEEFICEWDSQE